MSKLLISFAKDRIAEARQLVQQNLVRRPLFTCKPFQIVGYLRADTGQHHISEFQLDPSKTTVVGVHCSCNPFATNELRPPSNSTCKHVIAVILAYASDPQSVSSSVPSFASGSLKSIEVPFQPSTENPKKTRKNNKPIFQRQAPKKENVEVINMTRARLGDGTIIDSVPLDEIIRNALQTIAENAGESNSKSKDLPDLAYLVTDTEPGAFPQLKIINIKEDTGSTDRIVGPKSEIWSTASVQQRHINAVRKMVLSASDELMDCIDFFMYTQLWHFLLKSCLSTGKCYYQSLQGPALKQGPDLCISSFSWINQDGEDTPEMRTVQGFTLLPWSVPCYVAGDTIGAAVCVQYDRWYQAIWKKTDAPPDAREAVQQLINALLQEGTSVSSLLRESMYLDALAHFPQLSKALFDSEQVYSKSEISNLRFTLGISRTAPEIPLLRPWEPSTKANGESTFVPVAWTRVRKEGSQTQGFIAASWHHFRKHMTPSLLEATAVCTELWIEFLDFIVAQNLCYWEHPDEAQPLRAGPAMNARMHWQLQGLKYVPKLVAGEGSVTSLPWFTPMYVDHGGNKIGKIADFPPGPLWKSFSNLPPIPLSMVLEATAVIHSLNIVNLVGEPVAGMAYHATKPDTGLTIRTDERGRFLLLEFAPVAEVATRRDGVCHVTTRDGAWIINCRAQMKRLGFDSVEEPDTSKSEYALIAKSADCWRQLYEQIRQLKKEGFKISKATEAQLSPHEISEKDFSFDAVDVRSGWLSLSIAIKIDDEKINLLPVLISAIRNLSEISEAAIDALKEKDKFVAVLDDGRIVSMPFDRIKTILLSLREFISKSRGKENSRGSKNDRAGDDRTGDTVDVTRSHVQTLLENEQFIYSEKTMSDSLKRSMKESQTLKAHEELDPPAEFRTELRSYQKIGLHWLNQIEKAGKGGILADEMGLGKTVQVIAKLSLDKSTSSEVRNALIICPASLIGNWQAELRKLAPNLRVMQFTGPGRSQLREYIPYADVVLTTYGTFLREDREPPAPKEFPLETFTSEELPLTEIPWHAVYLDEAHTIKNKDAKITAVINKIAANYRICVTGTPFENHVGELWSLINFANPGLLPVWKDFNETTRKPIEEGDRTQSQLLRRIVAPYMLRRMKEDVLPDLPPKINSFIRVELTGAQADLYETVRLAADKDLRHAMAEKGFSADNLKTIEILTRLRQVCLHPDLCKLKEARKVRDSAKLREFVARLGDFLIGNRKILVFSQYTEMLTIIGEEIRKLGVPFLKLTGECSIDERTALVSQFQETDIQIFLISLKAGGTGLNLTRADTVILYDPWWNPFVENQAIDRAHRIGQTVKVFVFRMIASGTIEERILQLKAKKSGIANMIYGTESEQEEDDDAFLGGLTNADLLDLLSPISNSDSEV